MTLRFSLAVISLLLSLVISADNRSRECAGCWTRAANSPTVEQSLGVNVHFIEPRPGEVKMIADAGFCWIRTDFKWELTERNRGQYDFGSYDRLLKQLDEFGIRPLFILDYGNPLYTEGKSVRTPDARAAFARWAVAAARHFAGRGVVWELFNEPNNKMFWPPAADAAEYNALAMEVGRAFRASAPNEELIGPALASTDLRFLESCLNAHSDESWSAVSLHPYRQTNPETAAIDYAHARELIEKYRDRATKNLAIISSEWGYSSAWSRMDEQRQASMLARSFFTNLANGIALSTWYDWHDDGTDPREQEDHFGLVRYEYRPGSTSLYEAKPAFLAAKTLTTVLKGFRFAQRIDVGNADDYVLVFEKTESGAYAAVERRIVAWTTATNNHRILIPNLFGRYSLVTLTGGDGGKTTAVTNGLPVDVSAAPVYLLPAN